MKRNILYISLMLFLLCRSVFVFSQNQISVTATANRNQILIGEPIQLTLEAKLPLGMRMSWFPMDSIPHFDYIERGKLDSTVTEDGKTFRQDILITSFDSGTFAIPSLPLVINNQKYLTDSIVVQVSFSKINPSQEYHDIKDIIEVQNPSVKFVIWIIGGVTVISLALFIYFAQKPKKIIQIKKMEESVPVLSAYDEAIYALNELKNANLPESGHIKLYYTRLNNIFKNFILRRLQIASLSKTNDELIMQLRKIDMSREKFSQLTETLRMCDFVKFAKYIPERTDISDSFAVIRSAVDILNEIER
jgi:hypothetical protein